MNEGKLRPFLKDLRIDVNHKNRKGWLIARCPFAEFLHEYGSDRSPSFNIKINDEGYSGFNCFTCKQRGNLTTLVNRLADMRGEDYGKLAMRALLDETPENFKDFDESMDEAVERREVRVIDSMVYLRMYPSAWDDKVARSYLTGRGIGEKTCSLLDMRYDPEERRILFPVYGFDRSLYGFTGRSILPKEDFPYPKYPKVRDYAGLPKDSLILGEHLIDPTKPLLLVEGLFAVSHMVEIGAREFCNPVASMGSFLSDDQVSLLVGYDVPIYVLYDNDVAGEYGMFGNDEDNSYDGAVNLLREHVPTFSCLYPEGVDDPDLLDISDVMEMVTGLANEQA